MHPPEAQTKSKATNAIHDLAAVVVGEKVSREAVPDDSRKSGVLEFPSAHGDAGESPESRAINSPRETRAVSMA